MALVVGGAGGGGGGGGGEFERVLLYVCLIALELGTLLLYGGNDSNV